MVEIVELEASDARVRALMGETAALMERLFPRGDCHFVDPDAPPPEGLLVFGAVEGDAVLGIGGLLPCDGYGEVKSMFVRDAARERGLASALLNAVEHAARARGIAVLRLETGEALAAACRMYRRSGYRDRGAFGCYANGTTSIFMEKRL